MSEKSSKPYPDNNPKSVQGMKKVNLFLVPPVATIHEARAMEDGAAKYGPYNWREKSVAASIYLAAAKRHIDSWLDGEECAHDSGVHHLGHARACLGILLDAIETGNLVDDRPMPGATDEILRRFTKDDTARALAKETDIDIVPATILPDEAAKLMDMANAELDAVGDCDKCLHFRNSISSPICSQCIFTDERPNWEYSG